MKRSKPSQPRVQRDWLQYTRAKYGDMPGMVFRVRGEQRVVIIENLPVEGIPEGAWIDVVTRFDANGVPEQCWGTVYPPFPTGLLPEPGRRTHPQAPDANGVLGKFRKAKH